MCSSTRGPAMVPSLVTWPTRITATHVAWRVLISSCATGGLATRCRARIQVVHIHGLDGIDDGHIGGVRCVEGGKDVANIGCGREDNRRVGQTEAVGPQADLVDRLPRPRYRQPTCRHGPACAAACRSNVDLPIPGSPPTSRAEPGTKPPPHTRSSSVSPVRRRVRVFRGAVERGEGHCLAAAARDSLGNGRFGRFLDNRVPLVAGITPPRPFAVHGTAGLADEDAWPRAPLASWPRAAESARQSGHG